VAFSNLPLLALPENMEFEPLLQVHSSVIAAAGHPLAVSEAPSTKEIAAARWAVVNQPHAFEVLDSMFIAEGIAAPQPALQTNSLTLIKSLVLSSGFLCLLPEHMFIEEFNAGTAVRIQMPATPITRSAGLLLKKDSFRRPVADALGKEIAASIGLLSESLT